MSLRFTQQGSISILIGVHESVGNNHTLSFCVTDTGIGIREAQQEKLFQPFTQADNTSTREFGGTGLGLTICKKLCHLMGGDIRVESKPGIGSKFCFTALLRTGDTSQINLLEKNTPDYPELHGKRILVVEDNELNLELATELLRNQGLHITSARNGEVALEKLQNETFDAVLMDIQMPVMDGYTTTRKIRQQSHLSDLPIIAISANVMDTDREQSRAAGMNDFIGKPLYAEKMFNVLARWIVPVKVVEYSDVDAMKKQKEQESTDFELLRCIKRKMNFAASRDNGDLHKRMLTMFHKSLPDQADALRSARKSQNSQEIVLAAHQLKGAAMVVGAIGIENTAQALESFAQHENNIELLAPKVEQLLFEMEQLTEALGRFLAFSE